MTAMLITVLVFAVINYVLKAAGPVLLHGRTLPPRLSLLIDALPPALLAGMLISSVLGPQWRQLDPAVLAGLAAAATAWSLRGGLFVCAAASVVVTALWRYLL